MTGFRVHTAWRQRAMRSTTSSLIAVGFLVFAGACVMPATGPEESRLSGQPVEAAKEISIIVKQTDKAEIIERLGPPSLVWTEGNAIAYRWERLEASYVFGVWGSILYGDMKSPHALLLQFDTKDTVCRLKRVAPSADEEFGNLVNQWSKGGGSVCSTP